jgi:hypothetical protein
MSNRLNPKTDASQAMVYQIRIQGHLSRHWIAWFGDLAITLEDNGNTVLAALHSLLRKVRDLGIPLLSVNCVELGQADAPDVKQRDEAR